MHVNRLTAFSNKKDLKFKRKYFNIENIISYGIGMNMFTVVRSTK